MIVYKYHYWTNGGKRKCVYSKAPKTDFPYNSAAVEVSVFMGSFDQIPLDLLGQEVLFSASLEQKYSKSAVWAAVNYSLSWDNELGWIEPTLEQRVEKFNRYSAGDSLGDWYLEEVSLEEVQEIVTQELSSI